MRLLFDENLSPKLAESLVDTFPDSQHVSRVGLQSASDQDVWEYARANEYAIVTKDDDFRQRSFLFGPPPKVIWIRLGNCTTTDIENVLRDRSAEILGLGEDTDAALMVITRGGPPSQA